MMVLYITMVLFFLWMLSMTMWVRMQMKINFHAQQLFLLIGRRLDGLEAEVLKDLNENLVVLRREADRLRAGLGKEIKPGEKIH